jgi:hypothetical protein
MTTISELLLLPGLDGTSDLFEPFIAAAPRELKLTPLRLPSDREQSLSAPRATGSSREHARTVSER